MELSQCQARSAELLLEIEAEMRRIGLWAQEAPSAADLASPLPFCCDTLNFAQWLQFVFLPRMKILLEAGAALPSQCGLAPMAEESFRFVEINTVKISALLRQVDDTLTAGAENCSSH
ncbi:YqcC family protein [Methylogaea oryzae]|uniref:YqcC-like domain-containing protein n=1 Tax=Methylogaea oryzae TaxID=1295382 RepID=A0A8D4VMM7_9GAMM|nr:YqcC family protein [Methylogaea oryzae]BBL70044.1 hypothetical protein MoryE10_06500 [Methylogaea oryzae]